LPRRRQQLAKPCPKCGSNIGFVYLQTWAKPNYKKKIDYESGGKYLDYDNPVRKKLLQEPDRIEIILSEGYKRSVKSYFKVWRAFREIISPAFEKYHDLFQAGEQQEFDINSVIRGIDVLFKFPSPFSSRSMGGSGSFFDNRSVFGLDLIQWFDIARYARVHSYRETARKSGLSTNRMKKQLEEINMIAEEIAFHVPNLMRFIKKMKELKIFSFDVQLRSQWMAKCKSILDEFVEEQCEVVERATLEARSYSRSNDIQQEQKQEQRYRYYQIIHGKNTKRCGPFREEELPLELLIQYREKHKNMKTNGTNDQDYRDSWVKINSHLSDIQKRLDTLQKLIGSLA
jgi:hypothetical protein